MKEIIINVEGLGRKPKRLLVDNITFYDSGLIEMDMPNGNRRYYSLNKVRQLDVMHITEDD